MKIKKIAVLICLPFLMAFQSDQFVFKLSLYLKHDFFTCDNLGNLYVIKGDAITKLNADKKVVRTYSNKRLGKIFQVDASNPLRILIFYKDFSALVFLDSQLSQNGETVQLENFNLEQSDLACSSFNNGAWVYNRQNAELIRLDENLNSVIRTGNLNRLMNLSLNPLYLIEYNGIVYLSDKTEGILCFDIYGNYSKTIAIKEGSQVQARDEILIVSQGETIITHHLKTLQRDTMGMPMKNSSQARICGEELLLGYKDSICVFGKN